jgi:hypothetical protein
MWPFSEFEMLNRRIDLLNERIDLLRKRIIYLERDFEDHRKSTDDTDVGHLVGQRWGDLEQ